jgi:hypothetical protein
MGGNPKTTQTTNQTTKNDPWAATIPTLNKGIGQIDPLYGNTGPTANESGAFDALTTSAQAGNPYASSIGGLATDLLGNGERSGMVRDAYGSLKNSLTPYANMETNPYQNEAFTKATGYMSDDIMDRIKSQYAGAGYSPTGVGDFGQSVGEGISRGIAPTWLQAYENNEGRKLGAVKDLYNAGNQTSGILANYGQQGIGTTTAALQAKDAGANQMLSVESMRRNLPISNISNISDLIIPMAQLGGTSNRQGTTTEEKETPMWQQIMGGAMGGIGALGQTGAFGSGGWLLPSGAAAGAGAAGAGTAASTMSSLLPLMLSDVRAKEDIAEIGELYDGSPVYSFKYIGDPKTHVGLMAQEVEQRRPDAVVTRPDGLKMVDYGKATEDAGILGALGRKR